MSWRLVAVLAVGALFGLAACGPRGGASSQVPATSPSTAAASEPPTTAGAIEPPPTTSASPGASLCSLTDDPGDIPVTIADFEFKPAAIEAKVGQVLAFTNSGFEPHNATTADGGCGTKTLETGQSAGLVFSAPGSYKFGCTVHRWMSGTFAIAP
jgi:plastocyanin